MILNAKVKGFMDFLAILGCETHCKSELRQNQWDRHGEAAYEIVSIERRFWWSKSRFSRFKKTCTRGHQRAVPHKSRVKMVGDRLTVWLCEQELLEDFARLVSISSNFLLPIVLLLWSWHTWNVYFFYSVCDSYILYFVTLLCYCWAYRVLS